MLHDSRSPPVLEVIQGTGRPAASRYLPAGQANPRPTPRGSTIRYHGIPPPARISWLAILFSVGLHAVVLLGFNRHAPVRKIVVVDEPVEQMQMMPELEEEEDKPEELNDDEPVSAPSVSVPTLADVPVLVPVDANFIQQLDLTIPLKTDPSAGRLVAIPVHIQRGRPDESGIKNLFNISELDRPPEAIVKTPPDYPFELKREAIDARVRVGFIVNSRGDVILPHIVSSTHRGFERAALEGVKKWKFRPGMKNGRKVNTRVEQPIDFKVADDDGG